MGAKVTKKKANSETGILLIVNSTLQKYFCQKCDLEIPLQHKVHSLFKKN